MERIITELRRLLAALLSVVLVFLTIPQGRAWAQTSQPPPPPGDYSGQGVPLNPDQLQGLVAPIALYPDALVAQILSAATFPEFNPDQTWTVVE